MYGIGNGTFVPQHFVAKSMLSTILLEKELWIDLIPGKTEQNSCSAAY